MIFNSPGFKSKKRTNHMRFLIGLLFAIRAVAQPTVSNVRADDILAPDGSTMHSGFRVRWDLNSPACFHRMQAGKTSSYNITVQITGSGCLTKDLGGPITGLQAGLTYHYAVQSSFDGVNFSALTADATYTLPALPGTHPAPPQISGLWSPTPPSTIGCNVQTVASNCSDLQADLNTAVTNQPSACQVVTIPAGTVCSNGPYQFIDDPQILSFPMDASHVNTTTGEFTAVTIPSGWSLTNGQTVIVSGASCIPGSLTQGNDSNSFNGSTESCNTQGPITPGVTYFLVQVNSPKFKLSATNGGSPIIPGDTGQVGGTFMMEQDPPMHSNWITIQTSTPDSQFAPPGVRASGSIWASKMATIAQPGGTFNGNPAFTGKFTHHIYFRGIKGTFTDASSLANSTADPQASNRFFYAPYSFMPRFIVWDRSYFTCPPFPNRCVDFFTQYGGENMAIINSDLRNMNYWRPSVTPVILNNTTHGLQGSLVGQVLTIQPGQTKLGPINTCTSSAPITFTVTSGSATGNSFVDVNATNCVMTLIMPTGMTGTPTGSMIDSASTSHPAIVTTSASPGYLRDGSGGYNGLTHSTFTLTSGIAGGYQEQAAYGLSNWAGEGTQALNAGVGPGPWTFNNNFFEGTGLLLHLDDSGIVDPQKVSMKQNTFFWDQSHRMGSVTSDGYRYVNRNGPECKHCRQVKFDGNIINGWWADASPTGPAVLFHTAANSGTVGTAGGLGQPGYTVQDIDATYNTFTSGATAIEVGENPSNATPNQPAARIRIQNNLFTLINGFTQIDGNASQANNGGTGGNPIELDGAIEDLIIDHNTGYDNRGINPQPIWHAQALPIEGCKVTNNFFFFNGNNLGVTSESANVSMFTPTISGSGAALFNSECTNDPNTSGGIMTNNVAVPFWSNQIVPSGLIDPQSICSNFGGGTISGDNCPGGKLNTVLNHGSATANLAAIKFTDPINGNFLLQVSSPFHNAGSDGTDIGADTVGLSIAQGAVGTPSVTLTSSSTATISWTVADGSIPCALDYAIAPNDASTQIRGGRLTSSSGTSESVNLTGLSGSYNYRVLCPVNQPIGTFTASSTSLGSMISGNVVIGGSVVVK
jgi:hypothetical protein